MISLAQGFISSNHPNQLVIIMQSVVEISQPGKYLRINLHTEDYPQRRYTYFIAEKNNQRFLGHHTRLFFLIEDKSSNIKEFGYARELPKGQAIPFGSEASIPPKKMSFLVENVKQLKYDQKQSVEIQFTYNGKNLTWVLKFENQRIAENVYTLLENARNDMVQVVNNAQGLGVEGGMGGEETNNALVNYKNGERINESGEVAKTLVPFEGTKQNQSLQLTPTPNDQPLNNSVTNTIANNLQALIQSAPPQPSPTNEPTDPSKQPPVGLFTSLQTPTHTHTTEPQQPLTKISLVNIPEVQDKEFQKREFIRKMEEAKAKQEEVSKLSYQQRPERESHNVVQDPSKDISLHYRERQAVISNQNQIWNYQFLKGNEETIISQFKQFSEGLVSEIIDELCLEDSQRQYHPVSTTASTFEYRAEGLNIRLCFTGITEIKLMKNSKETIYDESAIKEALREFKNMDYLLKVTRNKGRVRLPLANMVEYKGVVALVRAEVEGDEKEAVSLSNELELISREARVKKNAFIDSEGIRIVPLLSSKYQKLARKESSLGRGQTSFDFYYLNDVKHLLPSDLNFIDKDPENKVLRAEFLQRQEMQNSQLMGQNIIPYISRVKTERGIQQSIEELEQAGRTLAQVVVQLLKEWQGLEVITLTSTEVEQLLHKHGVNMRYLGMLCDKATVPLIRKVCMSEIAARVAKVILRATLQEALKAYPDELTSKDTDKKDKLSKFNQCNQYLLTIALDFINSVVSETPQSQSIWKAMNKQAQYNFNLPLSKMEISEGYFVQALIHHCNLQFDWAKFPKDFVLFRGRLFRRDMVAGFRVRSKNYDLGFTDLYNRINSLLEDDSPENAEQVKSILNLRKVNIPDHFRLNKTYSRLALMLSNYVEPKYKDKEGVYPIPCTLLYDIVQQQPPSYTSAAIGLMEIKWALKEGNIAKAQKLLKQIMEKLTKWCGEIHPIYTQFYSVFAQYYLMKGEYEQATTFSRSALANETKLLGGIHHKIAERYFELAEIGFKASRKQDSLVNYRKAKNICDNIEENDTVPYADIELKIAVLTLEMNKLEEAESSCRVAVEIYERHRGEDGDYEREAIDCYELLMRIYEVWGRREEMEKISFYCGENVDQVKDVNNLEKALKVYLIPYFLGLKRKQTQKMRALFSEIPLQSNIGIYSSACTYIRRLIEAQKLIQTVEEFFDNFNEIYDEVVSNSVLTRWRGFEAESKSAVNQCLALMEALIYFLGKGFVLGAVEEL